jgi:membrane protease YdiL (CAAX protease family)
LPNSPVWLLFSAAIEATLFAVLFGLAWLGSRASGEDLRLRWRGRGHPILLGFAYSLGLRIALFFLVIFIVVFLMILGIPPEELMEKLRPKTEAMIDPKALTDPLYFILLVTAVSFVLGGLREELWRAGVLVGLAKVFPRTFSGPWGQWGAVVLVAVMFGMGHLYQGWAGAGMTFVLGLGLGAIMILHRSIWEAALAHGFFDAGTMVLLYLFGDKLKG